MLSSFLKEENNISKIKTNITTLTLEVLAFFASILGYVSISVGPDMVHFYIPLNV